MDSLRTDLSDLRWNQLHLKVLVFDAADKIYQRGYSLNFSKRNKQKNFYPNSQNPYWTSKNEALKETTLTKLIDC